MATPISTVTPYAGQTPAKEQEDTVFDTNIDDELAYINVLPVQLNTTIGELNTFGGEMEAIGVAAEADAATATAQAAIATEAANTATAAAADFTATSTTSTTIGTGSKVFAIETGKAFVVGQVVRIVSAANTANYMAGQITAASDGSITVNVLATGGSGTFADWSISLDIVNGASAVFYGSITEGTYVLTGSVLDPINGTVQYANLTGNVTYTENLTEGQNLTLVFDGGATYVVTLPALTWITTGGNVAPTFNGTKDAIVLWKQEGALYAAYLGHGGV